MTSLRDIAAHGCLNPEKLKKIEDMLIKNGNFSRSTIRHEIELFCTKLGMNEYYFKIPTIR